GAKPVCVVVATPPARSAGMESAMDKSLVKPTAKVVASPVAQASQRKINETSTSSGKLPGGPPRGSRQVCSSSLQGSFQQGQKGRRHREPLRSSMCRREGTDGADVVPAQRPDVEQAAKECPCQFKDGQKIVVEFDLMEPNTFDAKNGVIIRAGSVLPLE